MARAQDTVDLMGAEALLPESVRYLVAVLGLDGARRLIRAFGGRTLAVPVARTRAGDASYAYIAECVGETVAARLVAYCGGESFYIPRCYEALTEATYRNIRREFDTATQKGKISSVQAVGDLAQRYGYSDRRIWSILKRPDNTNARRFNPRQMVLFG